MSKFKLGDKVRIITNARGSSFNNGDTGVVLGYNGSTPDVKRDSDGRDQYVNDYDLELIAFNIGDRVRLRPNVWPGDCPYGGTTSREDGTVNDIYGERLRIKFDDEKYHWNEHADRLEHVKEEEMPVTKLYKALRVKPDGTLASLLIGHTTSVQFASFKELTYKEGEITYAPKGSRGVYCDNTLGGAEQRARIESNHGRRFEAVVHDVTVLGTESSRTTDTTCCPAVLVGRKVYGIAYRPPEPPKEEWKDVTKECTTKWTRASCSVSGGYYLDIYHNGELVASLGQGVSLWCNQYKVETVSLNYFVMRGEMSTIRVMKKISV